LGAVQLLPNSQLEETRLQRQTTIALWCERIIEGGWLFALVFIPGYFNLLSSRHFEPDKATSLRAIVLIMAAAGIIRALEMAGRGPARNTASPPGDGLPRRAWRRLNAIPLALPALVYVLVFLFATATSVVPLTSFWGSYQRLQGTYTNLSYVGLAAMIVVTLRRRDQLERLIGVAILGSLPAVGYGLVQHYQIDPLPWKGDVVSRVASTMGNSIFVAAYLIMIVPFALYRAIAAFHESRTATEPGQRSDLGWGAAYTLLALGSLALLFATIKFGAVVRTADLRYWWVYPSALLVVCGLYIVPTLRPHSAERITLGMLWPGILTVVFVLQLGFFFLLGQNSGSQQVQSQPGRNDTDWPAWLIGGMLLVVLAYVLFFTLPRRAAPSRLFQRMHGAGMLMIAGLLLITVFFTQSRGPWLGIAAGLAVFFTLLLWRAYRRARLVDQPTAARWRNLLIGEVALALVLGGFVVAFNVVDTPFFDQLRQTPYIGRLGTLLESDTGTGLVRRLIWFGDDKAGGAVGLITSDPLRAVIGWGPESMFVAYNKFYPPALANIEARGASPDRSHEAYLDELVTKGLLGLISYLFVLISFFALAWRLIQRTDSWRLEVLCLAAIAIVVSHLVEGLTGIPIVSTLMMLWVTMAVVVVAGALDGQYSLDAAPSLVAEPVPEPAGAAASKAPAGNRGGRRRQGAVARGAAQGRAVRNRSSGAGNPAASIVYAIIGILALAGVWFFNIDNVYADMRFNQGQGLSDNPNASFEQQLVGMTYYLDAIRMEPQQDFYYLNLGRSLMNLTDIKRQTNNGQLGQPKPDAKLDDLLLLTDDQAAQDAIVRQSPLETMSYAQVVLEEARQLNQLNKDHYANLARMHSFWYSRLTQDPKQLEESIEWYKRGHAIAPQDVTILNEYASAVALMGNYARAHNDEASAQSDYSQASQLLAQSKQLDARYSDTDQRMADVLRLQGQSAAATDLYVKLLTANPHALDGQITQIADSMRDQPDQLRRLRDIYTTALTKKPDDAPLHSFVGLISVRLGELPQAAASFGRWTQLQPQSIEAHRNYTLVLSDTRQYPQAVAEAQTLLTLAQQQQLPQDQQTAIQGLVDFLKTQGAGGK
jgi:tetratricopeptide (TPR) repeat protein/O-antigen ligase